MRQLIRNPSTCRSSLLALSERRRVARILGPALLALACFGCEGDADTTDDSGTNSLPPPKLELLRAETSERTLELPSDELLQLGCDRYLSISVGPSSSAGKLKNWVFRPPGVCAGKSQCGHLRVDLDVGRAEPLRVLVATTFATLRVDALPTTTGPRRLEATLLNDDGEEFLGPDGKPISDDALLNLAEPMGCLAGAGGSDGGGGAAGAAGQAGATNEIAAGGP